ncbi:MAG: hypothetical protein EPGJADBJ_00553 [Saprospiraceae bacterium]|nr:hypothetical protein [Saprospiraceae bacterium]
MKKSSLFPLLLAAIVVTFIYLQSCQKPPAFQKKEVLIEPASEVGDGSVSERACDITISQIAGEPTTLKVCGWEGTNICTDCGGNFIGTQGNPGTDTSISFPYRFGIINTATNPADSIKVTISLSCCPPYPRIWNIALQAGEVRSLVINNCNLGEYICD